MEREFILCDCGCAEHQVLLQYFPDEDDKFKVLYLTIHLVTYMNIFRRLWAALRYVFGYHCRYGHWDEIVVTKKTAAEMRDFIDKFLGASA